jgi:hypothetical protein
MISIAAFVQGDEGGSGAAAGYAAGTRIAAIGVPAGLAVLHACLAHALLAKASRTTAGLAGDASVANANLLATCAAEIEAQDTLTLGITHEVLDIQTAATTCGDQALPDLLAGTTEFVDLLLTSHDLEMGAAVCQALGIEGQEALVFERFVGALKFGIAALVEIDETLALVGGVHAPAAKIEVTKKVSDRLTVVSRCEHSVLCVAAFARLRVLARANE